MPLRSEETFDAERFHSRQDILAALPRMDKQLDCQVANRTDREVRRATTRPDRTRPPPGRRVLARRRRRSAPSKNSSVPISPATRPPSTPCSAASRACSNNSTATCTRSIASSTSNPISISAPCSPSTKYSPDIDPSAHVHRRLLQQQTGVHGLLNFPLTTLDQRLKDGPNWTRRNGLKCASRNVSTSASQPT